jgi:hypothetical protein
MRLNFIPPNSIAEVMHNASMRPATMIAASAGARETHARRKLLPINRVKPAVFRTNWHRKSGLIHPTQKRKGQVVNFTLFESNRVGFESVCGLLEKK